MTGPLEHWQRVQTLAYKLHSDGCTGVPNLWFKLCCYDHDIAYRTHQTAEGVPITRWEADRNLRHCMAQVSPLGHASILAWVYWLGVRSFGELAWSRINSPKGAV